MIEFKYLKEMEARGLKFSDLPEDAQICINDINKVARSINMLEKRGKKPTKLTLRKLEALDKWALYEIYDMVYETDNNEDEMPHEADDVIAEIEKQADNDIKEDNSMKSDEVKQSEGKEVTQIDSRGLKIDSDLKIAYDNGKKEISFDELKSISKTAYDVIFDSYTEGGENGIETSYYKLIEITEDKFTLTKK